MEINRSIKLEAWGEIRSRNRYLEAMGTWMVKLFLILFTSYYWARLTKICMLWLVGREVAAQTRAHCSLWPLWVMVSLLAALQGWSSRGTNDPWGSEMNPRMSLRILFSQIEKTGTPSELT